jgi:hypothetical protein
MQYVFTSATTSVLVHSTCCTCSPVCSYTRRLALIRACLLAASVTAEDLAETFGQIGIIKREKQKRGYPDQVQKIFLFSLFLFFFFFFLSIFLFLSFFLTLHLCHSVVFAYANLTTFTRVAPNDASPTPHVAQ